MPLEKSAGAIVFYRGEKGIEYLFLHHRWGHLDFPKGNIEKGENILKTVRREIEEETGLKKIDLIPEFKEYVKYFYSLKGKTIFKIVIFFLAETKKKEVKISPEHVGFKWLSYQEALKELSFKNAKDILKKAHEFLSEKSS